MATIQIKGKREIDSWILYMCGRIKKNKNNLVAVVGATGSGKTYSAISIAKSMSDYMEVPFGINNIVFTLRELMQLINTGIPNGSVIIFDEPQVSINSREFMSQANRTFNYLLTTFRHRNFTLFFCTPFADLLDKTARKLFHAKFELVRIDYWHRTTIIKPKEVTYNSNTSKFYEKYLKVQTIRELEGGIRVRTAKLKKWAVKKPEEALLVEYEKKKTAFTTNLNKRIETQLEKYDLKQGIIDSPEITQMLSTKDTLSKLPNQKNLIILKKPLTIKQQAMVKAINEDGITDVWELSQKLKMNPTNVTVMAHRIRSRGIPISVGEQR